MKQVGIVGAGVGGLLACRYVWESGFNPLVLEAKHSVGGVWAQTLQTTKLQNFKQEYQFSDFPWPSTVQEDFPDHNQVMEYIESYARHFNLLQFIKFNSTVKSIDYEGASGEEMVSWDLWNGDGDPFGSKGKWNITVEDRQTQLTEVYQVDFVILSVGMFSDLPNFPDFPPDKGPEAFNGKVIHSMEYSAMDDATAAKFIKGKRVAVVGIQKSALDIANECAVANGIDHPCTVIYRTAHWNIPDFFPWGVPIPLLYFHRFAEFMFHKPGEGILLNIIATLLSPLRWIISKFVESYVRWKFPLKKYDMVPDHGFDKDLTACTIAMTPNNFFDRVEEGSIVPKRSTALSFYRNGLILGDENTALDTDIVIFATGFKGDQKLQDIFSSPTFKEHVEKTVSLYRECIHPRIPQLAVIGYSVTLLNVLTTEMRCRWLAHLLKGTFMLPRIKEMEEDVLRWAKYMKKYSIEYNRRSFLGVLHIWYTDQLCRDMGCNPRRKRSAFAELFEPYGSKDYINLFSS